MTFWPTSYIIPLDKVKYSHAFGEGMIEIITEKRKVKEESSEITESFKNFSWNFWVVFGAFVIFIYLVWKVASKWNPRYENYGLLWGIFGVILNEAFQMPRRVSLRVLLLSFVFLVMLTKMHFSGIYKTSLVTTKHPLVYNTLEQILHSDLRPMFFRSDPGTNSFKNRDGILKSIWEKAEKMGLDDSLIDLDLYSPKQLDYWGCTLAVRLQYTPRMRSRL